MGKAVVVGVNGDIKAVVLMSAVGDDVVAD
jgi:hypothetical protein